MYVVAIKDSSAWLGDTPLEICMIGFWNLIVVWLKVKWCMLCRHYLFTWGLAISFWSFGGFFAYGLCWTGLIRLKIWYVVWPTIIPLWASGEVGTVAIISGSCGMITRKRCLSLFYNYTTDTYISLWEGLVEPSYQRCSYSHSWLFGTIFLSAFSPGVG